MNKAIVVNKRNIADWHQISCLLLAKLLKQKDPVGFSQSTYRVLNSVN